MPPRARTADNPTRRRNSPALGRARDELAALKKRGNDFRKKIREEKVPNALVNTSGTVLGAVGTGVVRGLVPDSIQWGAESYDVSWVKDGVGIVTGVGVGAVGAFTGMPYVIHLGGGVFAVCSAALAEKGTKWLADQARGYWAGNGNNVVEFPAAGGI